MKPTPSTTSLPRLGTALLIGKSKKLVIKELIHHLAREDSRYGPHCGN